MTLMQRNLVSVIIPTYNRYSYLVNAIESVLNQSYKNFEIIIVNDGSTQKEYYEKPLPKNVKLINLETNQKNLIGFKSNEYIRNFGIKAAEGEYLAFLDDDDIWLPEKLETQINFMKKSNLKFSSTEGYYGQGVFNPNKEYPLYNNEKFYNTIRKKYKGTKFYKRNLLKNTFKYPEVWTYEFLEIHNCVITSSTMVEKKLMNILGGFRGIPTSMNADYDCWLGLLRLTDLIYIDKPLFYYDGGHGDGQQWR